MSNTFNQVDSLIKELNTLPPLTLEQREKLDRKIRLEFNYNSNHIEGNTLTYGETKLLLFFDKIEGGADHTHREYEEMKASDVALSLIEELSKEKERPLTEAFIKNLNHVILVRPYWKEAETTEGQKTQREILVGDYKKYPNSVRLPNGEIFHYAAPHDVPLMMGDLIKWLHSEFEKNEKHPAEIAALLHYKFVRIHPFDDGNGRISRLLMNYVLYYFGLPPVIIKSAEKAKYLNALSKADAGNIEAFVEYVAQQLLWSLDLFIKARKNESLEEEQDWKKELHIIKTELNKKDEIKALKSLEEVGDIINNFLYAIDEFTSRELAEIEAFFLKKTIFYGNKKSTYSQFNKVTIPLGVISGLYYDNCDIRLVYNDFKKNGLNSFSIATSIHLLFEKYSYTITIEESTFKIAKLYHYAITEDELKEITNALGRSLTLMIKNNLNARK